MKLVGESWAASEPYILNLKPPQQEFRMLVPFRVRTKGFSMFLGFRASGRLVCNPFILIFDTLAIGYIGFWNGKNMESAILIRASG